MAVVTTISAGHDLGYVWHQQAGARTDSKGLSYYVDAKDAEAPGVWHGPGLAELGLEQGAEVQKADYYTVYEQTHPRTGERFGSRPGNHQSKAAILARLLAAEPHATTERLIELEREAAAATRQAPVFTDMTVSWSKSISLLEASIRASAHYARVDGDAALAAVWDAKLDRMHAILQGAISQGLEHAQAWAGFTRVGSQSQRYAPADIVVSSWLQGLSRSGSPQLHAHNQFARMTFTQSDGKARALATMALRAQLPAVTGIVAAHTESALSREFGVAWRARADGKGNEIAGISDAELHVFSERTRDIEELTAELIGKWAERNGRMPTEYEVQHITQTATMISRAGKEDGSIDWGQKTEDWTKQLDDAVGTRLADIATRVIGPVPAAGSLPRDAQLQAVREAVEIVSSQKSAWTRAELVRVLQTTLPTSSLEPESAVAMLHALATDAVSGRMPELVNLEAPQFPPLPDALRRELDGRSVYDAPGAVRYASRVTLATEQQLVQDASAYTTARMDRAAVAEALGADPDALEHALSKGAAGATLDSGLRLDQAAALAYVLSSPRTMELLVGPAGSGKTRTAGQAAAMWPGRVIATAVSQNATNELRQAGFEDAANTTRLVQMMDRNEFPAGTLVWLDEISMVSTEHMARIAKYAATNGCRVVGSGDHQQLQAVESGGGMGLLANRMGYVQLQEPQRFEAPWERDASLALRAGQESAIDIYAAQGRLRGGAPEDMHREAVRAYVAERLAGRDVILLAQSWDRCRELSRQIRLDLQHLGIVDKGRHAELSEGQRASAGDRIIARQNDHGVLTGEDRALANGDVLVVDEVRDDGLLARRVLGEGEFGPQFVFTDTRHADLAYAVSAHSAQGGSHDVGLTLVSGVESRQWLYSAMTRGRLDNTALVITRPRKADANPSLVPAPEIGRREQELAFQAGNDEPEPAEQELAITSVMMDVLRRDGTQLAALDLQAKNLSEADHLGELAMTWDDLVRGARAAQYEQTLRDLLPEELRDTEISTHGTWLWRTVRQAEELGYTPEEALRNAIEVRDLRGSRDIAAVLDMRARKQLAGMTPTRTRTWTERTPELADSEVSEYARELAGLMDRRVERLGKHVTETQPQWLVRALGPAPEGDRQEYEHRASAIAAYREQYAITDDRDAIGAEPSWDSPEKRSAWQAAAMARGGVSVLDLGERSDASLWHMRGSYATITQQAPEHPGHALEDVRVRLADAGRKATRSAAEAEVARAQGELDAVGAHERAVGMLRQSQDLYQQVEKVLSVQADLRDRWSRLTEGSRLHAVAADTELRRRYPEQKIEPLKSAEPVLDELSDLSTTLAMPGFVSALADRQPEHEDRLARMGAETVPHEDTELEDLGPAWGGMHAPDEQPILQPPVQDIEPAPEYQREVDRG